MVGIGQSVYIIHMFMKKVTVTVMITVTGVVVLAKRK